MTFLDHLAEWLAHKGDGGPPAEWTGADLQKLIASADRDERMAAELAQEAAQYAEKAAISREVIREAVEAIEGGGPWLA